MGFYSLNTRSSFLFCGSHFEHKLPLLLRRTFRQRVAHWDSQESLRLVIKPHCYGPKQVVNKQRRQVCSAQSLEAKVVSDCETKLNFPVISIYERLAGILHCLDQTSVGWVVVGLFMMKPSGKYNKQEAWQGGRLWKVSAASCAERSTPQLSVPSETSLLSHNVNGSTCL